MGIWLYRWAVPFVPYVMIALLVMIVIAAALVPVTGPEFAATVWLGATIGAVVEGVTTLIGLRQEPDLHAKHPRVKKRVQVLTVVSVVFLMAGVSLLLVWP